MNDRVRDYDLQHFALTNEQNTAASETGLCKDDVLCFEPVALAREIADRIDIDPEGTFVDVSDNPEIACIWCGR